MITRTIWWTC